MSEITPNLFKISNSDLQRIENAAKHGLSLKEIASLIGKSGIKTASLIKILEASDDVRDAYERGAAAAQELIGMRLLDIALKGNLGAIKYLENTRWGKVEKKVSENTHTHKVENLQDYFGSMAQGSAFVRSENDTPLIPDRSLLISEGPYIDAEYEEMTSADSDK